MSDAVISRVLKDCDVSIEQTTGTLTNSVSRKMSVQIALQQKHIVM